MERLKPSLRGSTHSLTSDAVSEEHEIKQIQSFLQLGEQEAVNGRYEGALRHYNDALDIDGNNVAILCARAAVYIERGNYVGAQKDAQKILVRNEKQPQAHYLLGVSLEYQGQHKNALMSFLRALTLDTSHASMLSEHITALSAQFCQIPKSLKAKDYDPYKRLVEAGLCMYHSKKYELSLCILEGAQKLETNQQGITMKMLLTMANCHSALKHPEVAISLYQDCLAMSQQTHDLLYQTKTLVNIASLFLQIGDTHQAIVYYEKLAALEKDLDNIKSETIPETWSKDLRTALHLNLSIAYKTIGNLKNAVNHAQLYVSIVGGGVEPESPRDGSGAQAYQHLGMLHFLLSNYEQSLKYYKTYLQKCKVNQNRAGMAQAYGALGNIYGALRNRILAETYHDQHIAIARKLKDAKLTCSGWELYGDTLMGLKEYEQATECYGEMLKVASKGVGKTRVTACCKLASAYKAMDKYQYSIFYYEEGCRLCEELGWKDMRIQCQFNLACILQHSTQHSELTQAHKYFSKLIPLLEKRLATHRDEEAFTAEEVQTQLQLCYEGMQCVQGKEGKKEEALQCAEMSRHHFFNNMADIKGTGSWDFTRLRHIVASQNATVLYFSVTEKMILVWIICPVNGLIRFHSIMSPKRDLTMKDHINNLVDGLWKTPGTENGQYNCEDRALPRNDTSLELIRRQYQALSKAPGSHQSSPKESTDSALGKSAERQLFNFLLGPIEDNLRELPPESPLVIIPDRELWHVPFHALEDWNRHHMYERLHITYVPCLALLDKVTKNELEHEKIQRQLQHERSSSRLGGLSQYIIGPQAFPRSHSVTKLGELKYDNELDRSDPKETSYPRLLKSGALNSPLHRSFTKEDTFSRFPSTGGKSEIDSKLRKSCPVLGTPATLGRVLGISTIDTLVSKTATGGDIVTSPMMVTDFLQVSGKDKCMVFGNPKLPQMLRLGGKEWRPPISLLHAQAEAHKVASYMEVEPIIREEATKGVFLDQISQATVLHIATFGSMEDGLLVWAPKSTSSEPFPEDSFLVTAKELAAVELRAQLVVLSCGYSSYPRSRKPGYLLPSAFLQAGAQCVLSLAWSLPNPAQDKFFYHFYNGLQNGRLVSIATAEAIDQLKQDDRFESLTNWAPFTLLGKDTHIDLGKIRHSMLDQEIDKVETAVAKDEEAALLNPKDYVPKLPSHEEKLSSLQDILVQILVQHSDKPDALHTLIRLLDDSLKRLHNPELNTVHRQLPEAINDSKSALTLLQFLDFQFQSKEEDLTKPFMIFPYHDDEHLVSASYECLKACSDILSNEECMRAVVELFPISQHTISQLIDVLAISKHAQEVQLKVSDLTVRPLWNKKETRALLTAIGFQQIGIILNFCSISKNKVLQSACLQLLLSLSTSKSNVLLHKLDVTLLGTGGVEKRSHPGGDNRTLPTLTPVMLPRNQLRLATPWMSSIELGEEMRDKIKLADSEGELYMKLRQEYQRAKTWHQLTIGAQGGEILDKVGRPRTTTPKVKVKPGSSASRNRVPISHVDTLTLPETAQRRDYAQYLLNERLNNINIKHKNDIKKIYLPYVSNSS
ncbi:unnamed protein product [Owenia fusiformis]|uniref:Uncharacterized protein n=1 Tax=Owenia fusiformis TaxID=6347 RepID=A0A8J1Y582_OWEFU|nr:unnamed protein product [Owenia fusiformis]